MRGVDHDPLRFAALGRQFGENLVEHAEAAPANKPIVDCLVRAIVARSVAPTQPVLDHKDDRADDPPIVHPRNPRREWKIPFNPTHRNPRQQKQISHGEASQPPPMNQPSRTQARTLIGPEPRVRTHKSSSISARPPLGNRSKCRDGPSGNGVPIHLVGTLRKQWFWSSRAAWSAAAAALLQS